jgi:hypothetical protein
MSGYLQYSNYGDDEPIKPSTVVQPKRTLRTNQRTLRSKQSLQQYPQQGQHQQPQQGQHQQPQQPQQPQPQPQQQQLQVQGQMIQNQNKQHKYVQELIQKIHNSETGTSDTESDADADVDSNDYGNAHMQQQFQTEPVPNRNRFAAANSADLNARLNPAPAKEAFTSKALANKIQGQYQQYMPSVFQASGASEAENKDVLLQKLDHIISLLEDQHDEKTGHVTEELVLYCFLGVFIIFIVDSFARAGKYVR